MRLRVRVLGLGVRGFRVRCYGLVLGLGLRHLGLGGLGVRGYDLGVVG